MVDIDWKEILGWDEEHVREARSVGYLYYKQGAYEIAAKCFEALIVINPYALYELQTLGAIYLEMNRAADALLLFERALSIQPSHEPTLLNRAKALAQRGDKNGALSLAEILEKSSTAQIAKQASMLRMSLSGAML
jgi:tetratricopeptide (TPR) repeat protein